MIIGISGKFGVGKDTAAAWIKEEYPHFELKSFAFALKKIVSELTGTSFESQFTQEGKAHVPQNLSESVGRYQQLVGQHMREIFGKNVWVNIVFNGAAKNIIITDVRYPSEVEAIESRDGIVIRINRDNVTLKDGRDANHSSETALDNHDFKYVIDNNGTLDEFRKKLFELLIYF